MLELNNIKSSYDNSVGGIRSDNDDYWEKKYLIKKLDGGKMNNLA